MESEEGSIRVAIACQGGGSHTAFTAGVLTRLFQSDVLDGHTIVGMSGTSGGAMCALLAWSALRDGDPERAGELLAQFWQEMSASTPTEWFSNRWMLWAAQLSHQVGGAVLSPYDTPFSGMATAELRTLLEKSIDFDRLGQTAGSAGVDPLLVIGAVDVLSGDFKAFDSRLGEITVEAVLASAAIPTMFRAVHVQGAVYWDGLFSQNPPVRDLLKTNPDEIWVIQINPTDYATEPKSSLAIADRRNELAGNLSLHQELHFIEKMDSMIAAGDLVGDKYQPITIRVLEMPRSKLSERFGPASKLNRDPEFLAALMDQGKERADEFVTAMRFEAAWKSRQADAVLEYWAPDAEIVVEPPFRPLPDDREWTVADFVEDRVCNGVEADLNRKQITCDGVTWRVRSYQGAEFAGQADCRFRDGKLVRFHLGPIR